MRLKPSNMARSSIHGLVLTRLQPAQGHAFSQVLEHDESLFARRNHTVDFRRRINSRHGSSRRGVEDPLLAADEPHRAFDRGMKGRYAEQIIILHPPGARVLAEEDALDRSG